MKLQSILRKNRILLDVQAQDKDELIARIARYLAASYSLSDPASVIHRIQEREADMSTGIGFGIAIPHARVEGLGGICMIASRSAQPVDYQAIDDQPVRLVFMMLSPMNTSTEHTSTLSRLSKIMANESTRQALTEAKKPEDFLSIIVEAENALD